ncbi:nuclease-related domain-containing protein [Demequina salsinemoris]|uniref:nuclease-related domain-containing protein n=1 Tax=Demequina salsinemoris TaxID=577470 RepID=UPI000784580C|nr:nuclease-related domain-containing protein [Demequina salsinemoris]
MTGFTVTRLGAPGRDRVRVARADGTELGWIDLGTGCLTVSPEGDAELVDLAVRAWAAREHIAVPALDPPDDPARILAAAPGPTEIPGVTARDDAEPHDDPAASDAISARLDRLADVGWQVLHGVPFGPAGSRLDHLLVGPGGVFTVTTRNHRGKRVWIGADDVMVDGRPANHLLDARADADIAGRLLSDATGALVEVRPTLVIVAGAIGQGLTFLQPPADVAVLRPLDLPDHFERRAGVLTLEEVDEIANAARRPATWH